MEKFLNLSKTEIIEKLNDLQVIANEFESNKGTRDVLAVGIVWIGASLGPQHDEILNELEVEEPEFGSDGS